MEALTGAALIRAWEAGQGRHPVDQALAILAAAFPERAPHEWAALPVGQRDARLLSVYERSFGPRLDGLADCPQCATRLEFNLDVAQIRVETPDEWTDEAHELRVDGWALRYRLPNSSDLAAVARAGEGASQGARRLLVERCVLDVQVEHEAQDAAELPDPVLSALSVQMAAHDPQAEVQLDLTCAECGHAWAALLDIVPFVWSKIATQAVRLLYDVHLLARAYGWREADILAMSPARRQFYLDRARP